MQTSLRKKRIIDKNYSFKVFEDKNSKRSSKNISVYDFTFDPSEEPPPPQKKKRKQTTRKKAPPKPKNVIIKNNYEKNISKTLESLKSKVQKPSKSVTTVPNKVNNDSKPTKVTNTVRRSNRLNNNNEVKCDKPNKTPEVIPEFINDINYSPVITPNHANRPQIKMSDINDTRHLLRQTRAANFAGTNKDPLNLLDEVSFFDEEPIACSSLNNSLRNPTASPWRVEYSNLPLKFQVCSYTKPNMTPAVESSFVCPSSASKKHVYTNMMTEPSEPLPEIFTNDSEATKTKQTSILAFFRDKAEKSLQKKLKSMSPLKNNNKNVNKKTPTKSNLTKNNNTDNAEVDVTEISNNNNVIEAIEETPVKQTTVEIVSPKKVAQVENNLSTCFGFDDSENQENISPKKKDNKARVLRSKSRAVLRELNQVTAPSRAKVPLTKSKVLTSNTNKLFDKMKATAVVEPQIIEETPKQTELNTVNEVNFTEDVEEDSNSVHLFEDIDVVHHMKPSRKSYGKAKKLTFCNSVVDNGLQNTNFQNEASSEDEDELFEIPTVKEKKIAKKKSKGIKLTKKEEEEVEAWAAAFNSMCEDVDAFPLEME